MWTTETRLRYNRDSLRYPSDLTDDEWALVAPLVPPAKRGGRRRSSSVDAPRRLLAHRNLGRKHPGTLATRHNLAAAIDAQGRSAEAEAMYREVLPLQEKVLGREHPGTLATRHDLAGALEAQGRSADAQAETMTALQRVLGDGHPDTKTTVASLTEIRSGQGGGE